MSLFFNVRKIFPELHYTLLNVALNINFAMRNNVLRKRLYNNIVYLVKYATLANWFGIWWGATVDVIDVTSCSFLLKWGYVVNNKVLQMDFVRRHRRLVILCCVFSLLVTAKFVSRGLVNIIIILGTRRPFAFIWLYLRLFGLNVISFLRPTLYIGA